MGRLQVLQGVASFVLALSSGIVYGQTQPGQYHWEESTKRIKASDAVAPLGPNMSGDAVNLSNGALGFNAVDVSLPGNDKLEVEFARSYSVISRKHYSSDSPLADWVLETPHISGVFAPDWEVGYDGTAGRCSSYEIPRAPTNFHIQDFWQGVLIRTGDATEELLKPDAGITTPTDGRDYKWVTAGQTHVSCLTTIKNGSGEGFLAITPDGTRYWFDWMAQYQEPTSNKLVTVNVIDNIRAIYTLHRKKNVLYATRVEDRFGNYVTYTYLNASNARARLDSITASDGRKITVGYNGALISTVTANGRTWKYDYSDTASGRKTLSSVTLPDNSVWGINFAGFTNAEIKYPDYPPFGEPIRNCWQNAFPDNLTATFEGSITHPAGATGRFVLDIKEHGRNQVPLNCIHVTTGVGGPDGNGNDPNDDVNLYATSGYSLTLKTKELTGPGLAPAKWDYSYVPNHSTFVVPGGGGSRLFPVCRLANPFDCAKPRCLDDSCAKSSITTVSGPNNEWVRYSHGNTYLYNEGKLLKVERGSGPSNVLEVTDYSYDFSMVNGAYPAKYGSSMRFWTDGFQAEFHRPELTRSVAVQGATFERRNTAFNKFALPTEVLRSSSLGYSRKESLSYEDNLAKWVLGLVTNVGCVTSSHAECNGQSMVSATYDAVTGAQKTFSSFGKLKQSLTYNADGTVATVADGANNTISLSQWKRGIPQLVRFPATPESPSGAVATAVVNDNGLVDSATNEAQSKTCYAYDAMGRMKTITYPSETTAGECDTSAYLATTQTFEPVASTEYGIPAGHWRLTRSTGNARKITYFDGRWRPVVQREYDNANQAATQRIQRFAHDHEGRQTFASQIGAADNSTYGRKFEYDALGRPVKETEVTSAKPDGWVTETAYLDGFVKSVTNPLDYETRLSFMAFDEPTHERPVSFDHPGTMRTEVVRNAFGNPTTLTRRNDTDTLHQDRTYAYYSTQELCKRVEPESGATLFGYDAAGNLAWSASGLPAATACEPTGTTPAVAARKATRGYDARNRVTSLSFPDGLGNTTTTYTPDSLVDTLTANNAGPWLVSTSHTYNKRRLLKQEKLTTPDQAAGWPIDYAYNSLGARLSQTWQGLTIGFSPNALGQPTRAGDFATDVVYHPHGAVASFTYGNGVKHTMTPDDRQLPGRSQDLLGTTALLDLSYQFDGNGNVGTVTDAVTGGYHSRTNSYDEHDRLKASVSNVFGTASYTYNDLDQITRTVVGASAQHAARDHFYCYETATRRLARVRKTGCADANPLVNALGYDVQGNLASKDAATYSFDFGNRMLWSSTGGVQTAYAYDGHGRRVKDSVGGTGRQSQYDAEGKLVYVLDERAGKKRQHVYLGDDLIAIRDVMISSGAAARRYQHSDALGSPLVVTDGNGAVVEQTRYEPYGQQVNRPMTDGVGYTGHLTDASSGLVYAQQRYYDPSLGLFLSVDPVQADVATAANFARYVYANNNPVRFKDPDGRQGVEALFPENSFDMPVSPLVTVQIIAINNGVNPEAASAMAGAFMAIAMRKGGSNKPSMSGPKSGPAPTPAAAPSATPGGNLVNGGAGPVGGRLGNQTTRQHIDDVATEMERRGWTITHGGGPSRGLKEEYLPGPGGRRKGSSYPDITATKKGRTLRVNTVDTRADGITPTTREATNAARIRQQTGEHVLLVPKP